MGDISGNGYVRWKGLIMVLTPILGGMLLFSYSVSGKNLSIGTFLQFEKRFERLENSQARIEKAIIHLTDVMHRGYKRE